MKVKTKLNYLNKLVVLFLMIATTVYSQSITNTLGSSGVFTIKDGSTTFLSLNQSTGFLLLNRSLTIPNTTSSTTGVIFKGVDRFMHNYQAPGTDGVNTFIGMNSGNFTMLGSGVDASYNTGIGSLTLFSLLTGNSNVAIGVSALYYNSVGNCNTALGNSSMYSNSTGYNNTAVGCNTMVGNTTGFNNSALGLGSLHLNTTGSYNTAMGYYSLNANSIGSNNTAIGTYSLRSNSSGTQNTALGETSLYSNTSGTQNTAVGFGSLYSNTLNSGNTSVGWNALYLSTGYQNTAVGHHSLNSNTTGNYNTALGYNSGSTITTGSNLTCIGIDAAPTSETANDQVTLGNGFVSSLRCNVQSISSLSDVRDKKNIKDLTLGLDFITKLKPRQFNWDRRDWYEGGSSDGSKMQETPTAGFIAQELDEAQTTENVEWLNLVLKDNPEKWEATPGNLLPIMVKAIQELKEENVQLKTQLEDVKEIKEQLAEIKILKEELNKQIRILKSNNKTEDVEFSSVHNYERKK